MIDEVFRFWVNVIQLVINLILSNPITSSFFGMFVVLVVANVIYQIYSRRNEEKS